MWKSFEKVMNTCKEAFFKNFFFYKNQLSNFNQSKINFDRSKNIFDWSSINRAAIEPSRFKPKFLSHFRSIERQIRSIEDLKKSKFWKIEHFNAKNSQSTMFYEWNASVLDSKFFKNKWIQPRSFKNKFFNQFVLKTPILNIFCIRIKEHLILDGHNKITHNIMY